MKMPLREMGSAGVESLLALLEGRAGRGRLRRRPRPSSSCAARPRPRSAATLTRLGTPSMVALVGQAFALSALEVVGVSAVGQLDGKVAIVTGAGTGLGRGIAEELARGRRGRRRAGDRRRVGARWLRGELAELGVEARAYPTDVRRPRAGRRRRSRRPCATSAGSTSSSTTPASAGSALTRRTSPTRTGTTRSPSCRPASSTACARRGGSSSPRARARSSTSRRSAASRRIPAG